MLVSVASVDVPSMYFIAVLMIHDPHCRLLWVHRPNGPNLHNTNVWRMNDVTNVNKLLLQLASFEVSDEEVDTTEHVLASV